MRRRRCCRCTIDVPESYFQDVLHRQAVVNRGVTFRLRVQRGGTFETTDYCYADGILDYVKELAGEDALTVPTFIETERRGRDRADKPDRCEFRQFGNLSETHMVF